MTDQELVREAIAAREMSYCPYSHFAVGAALLTREGRVYRGCNIENAAFTPGNCAERTAIFQAVSQGDRQFTAIAIVGGQAGQEAQSYCPPCGVCRQVLKEFCKGDMRILLGKAGGDFREYSLEELLPMGFGPDNL